MLPHRHKLVYEVELLQDLLSHTQVTRGGKHHILFDLANKLRLENLEHLKNWDTYKDFEYEDG